MSEKKAFPLRISQDLWEELQRAAAEEFRSVNGQIEFLLREALKKRGKLDGTQDQENTKK